jgi:hypothetical protein
MRIAYVAGRFVLGYVAAIGVGALLFALVECFFPEGFPFEKPPTALDAIARQIWEIWVFGFVFGGISAVPYTIVGALVFRFLLPQHWIAFMIAGMLCPMIAIMTLNVFLGGGMSVTSGLAHVVWTTLPAGVVATYLFGAIGFGLGFGRWRFG